MEKIMNEQKLKSGDLISIAIFSMVFILAYYAVSALAVMTIILYPFCITLAMVPCGIVWAYLRTKIRKPFAILVQGILFALCTFILGSGWFIALGILVGAILAELIAGAGKYKSFKWNAVGYAAFAVCLNAGAFILILLAPAYYYEFGIGSGMDAGYMENQIDVMSGSLLLLTSALSIVGAVLGMLLGRAVLKKHFVKAGII
jgi:energy-coupling factor transport system substrate-specific component